MTTRFYASPLRYPGGKSLLMRFLVEVIQANGLGKPDYIEPYAGGAGAALHLLFDEYVEEITINDADPRIQAFWQAVTKRNDDFLDRLSRIRTSVTEWKRQRDIYEKRDLRKQFELGFAVFYLNRTSRSGIVRNAGPIGGHDQTGKYKIDARFYRKELMDRIARIGRYAHRIHVSGMDGLSLLRRLDGTPAKAARTLAFLDPPYYDKGSNLYLNGFDHGQHNTLAEFLKVRRRFAWVMTYDNTKEIRALYDGFSSIRFDLSYSAFERRAGQELLIHPTEVVVPNKARIALRNVA